MKRFVFNLELKKKDNSDLNCKTISFIYRVFPGIGITNMIWRYQRGNQNP